MIYNIKDAKLLRAIERRMYDYLKVERGIEIDNMRKPMNDADYGKMYKEVERVLKNTNWKKDINDLFKL